MPHHVTGHDHGNDASVSFGGEANQSFTYTASANGSGTVVEWQARNPDIPVSFVVIQGDGGTNVYLYDAGTSDTALAVPGALERITFGYAPAAPAAPDSLTAAAARRCLKWAITPWGEKVCVSYA